ncbi:MAG TPA: 2-amino-4-hydroxy-6-hydroxymethyldihydropteridine diphosphokinase [Syntrophales bacterium]|nr:2-amino-4-hydroxy-6-hydroxymethyldihydropteridine diphosphokinase [Syntrophales bacterium]
MTVPVISYLGIGSNLGDPIENCRTALREIASLKSTQVLRRSSLYRTEPVGDKRQDWFVNGVLEVRTAFTAPHLLKALQWVEQTLGRVRTEKWGPRTIDIDILLYGQEIIETGDLVIPHPEMHKRRFVLVPINEIAPYVIHPRYGVSMKGLLDRLEDSLVVERIEADW